MAEYPNYIKDENPFNLTGPPKWFQSKLWEFDPSLVIIPSRQDFCYRLAQRRKLNLPEHMVADIMKEQADARMLSNHSLVPVTTIMATVRWDNPLFFMKLTEMAPWRMGGAQKYEQLVLDQDRKETLGKRAKTAEHVDHLSKDAWLYYNKKIGTRTHAFETRTAKPKTEQKSAGLIIPGSSTYQPTIQSGWGDVLRKRKG